MIAEKDLKQIIEQVLKEMGTSEVIDTKAISALVNLIDEKPCSTCQIDESSDEELFDITAARIQDELNVPEPFNREEYMKYKQKTPARVGVFRAGPRYKTNTMLRFRADHAVAWMRFSIR